MYTIEKIKNEIASEINKALGNQKIQASDLVYPPAGIRGDISWPCFNEKKIGCTAEEAFSKIAQVKNKKWSVQKESKFINFVLEKSLIADELAKDIDKKKENYGTGKKNKKRVMVEFTNANTHKEYHVGHLRNLCLGDSVSRVLAASGYDVVPVSYINDFGINVAKTLWAYNEFYRDKELPENKGRFLGSVYVRSTKEIEKNKTAKGMVELLMKKIETRKGEEYKLWQKTRKWSIAQFDQIYQEMDIHLDHIFYESEFIEEGKTRVDELMKKGIYKKSQGAIIADLEKFNLGVLVVVRSDGTTMYPVADVPLAITKIKKYKLDRSVYVVDNRQKLYFQQLFKILELLGYKQDMFHLEYDFVKLPSGMMSSRSGNVITYEDLFEKLYEKTFEETKKRHEDWSNKKIKEVARTLAIGAIKFEMTKVGSNQIINFDIDKALKFDGFTSAYIQYTYARINSILNKNDSRIKNIDFVNLSEAKEHELIMVLSKYPEAVERANRNYDPSEIAKYLFELSQASNDFYHSLPVLKAEEKIKIARLKLLELINQVLQNGLNLLGIKTIKEM